MSSLQSSQPSWICQLFIIQLPTSTCSSSYLYLGFYYPPVSKVCNYYSSMYTAPTLWYKLLTDLRQFAHPLSFLSISVLLTCHLSGFTSLKTKNQTCTAILQHMPAVLCLFCSCIIQLPLSQTISTVAACSLLGMTLWILNYHQNVSNNLVLVDLTWERASE